MIRVLFESHHLYYLPHFTPIMTVMQERARYSIAASLPLGVPSGEREAFARAVENLDVEYLTAGSESDRLKRLHDTPFDVIIVGNVGRLPKIAGEHTLAVMVYHGIGLKQSYYRDISPRVDIRAVESEERFEELRALGFRNSILTGFTKLDPLAQPAGRELEQYRAKLNLDPDVPTMLYAPTFYPSSLERLAPSIQELARDMNVILKLHNFSWFQKRYARHHRLARSLAESHAHICLVPPEDYDILPCYRLADVLLSDLSSTLFEFLATGKPVIKADTVKLRLKHRLFQRRIQRRLDARREQQIDFAYPVNAPEDLVGSVHRILVNPDELAGARQSAARRYLYRLDGQASHRLVDAIEKNLGERIQP
ncbi:CDP-glycerol glycerophosphotransferase family protein [Candidatus Neomarinimicrobiota bacterium]